MEYDFAAWDKRKRDLATAELDPRPDLTDDHARWERVLQLAPGESDAQGQPRWNLDGVRSMGARLDAEYHIQPGEYDPAEWARDRAKYLEPYKAIIYHILRLARQGELARAA